MQILKELMLKNVVLDAKICEHFARHAEFIRSADFIRSASRLEPRREKAAKLRFLVNQLFEADVHRQMELLILVQVAQVHIFEEWS